MFSIFFISLFITIFLLMIFSFFLVTSSEKYQKTDLFECGFNKIKEKKMKFSNQFFLISILFLIFDLEIILMLPYLLEYSNSSMKSYLLEIFILVITFFLIIEWIQGIMEWSK